jgi:hypothetical protein
MESWFCIWDDLLRLFAIARVSNPKNVLNLVLDPLYSQDNLSTTSFDNF